MSGLWKPNVGGLAEADDAEDARRLPGLEIATAESERIDGGRLLALAGGTMQHVVGQECVVITGEGRPRTDIDASRPGVQAVQEVVATAAMGDGHDDAQSDFEGDDEVRG